MLNLGAAFFWGVTFALFVIPVKALGSWRFGLVLESTVLVTALLIATSSPEGVALYRFRKNISWYILMGCLGFGGLVFYNSSLRYLEVSVISIASLSTIFISLCLSKWWLKERLTLKQSMGVALLLAAIFVLRWHY